jgi:hypothetical protein
MTTCGQRGSLFIRYADILDDSDRLAKDDQENHFLAAGLFMCEPKQHGV